VSVAAATAPGPWTRRKLQVLLALTVLVLLALLAGGIWSMTQMLGSTPSSQPAAGTRAGGAEGSARDRLANSPLPSANLEAAQPGALSTDRTGTLVIPGATAQGVASVPSGFPHTAAGALAQLAAIDQSAIGPASVSRAQQVISAWATGGGPTAATWSGVRAVAALLTAAGLPADGTGNLTVGLTPSMGLIKGTIGTDFVVPCIDFIITTTVTGPTGAHTDRVAVADCQRMVWSTNPDPHTDASTDVDTGTTAGVDDGPDGGPGKGPGDGPGGWGEGSGGRWVIGPGSEPAPAPSLWPGTAAATHAGYKWLQVSR
jgi:hypothetical protein